MSFSNKELQTAARGMPAPQYYNQDRDEYEVQQGKNGASFIQSKVEDVILHSASTSEGYGFLFTVGSNKTVTIEITGTSTSRTVVFEAASVSGTFYPIQGVRISDYHMATQTTGKDEVWTFDVTGLMFFRARLTAVSGGTVSINGKAVY